MQHRGNEPSGWVEDACREQDPDRSEVTLDERIAKGVASPSIGAQRSVQKRDAASWVNWQSALYLFVMGWMCVFLVPLTSFWWIVPVLAAAVPIALATLDRSGFVSRRPDDKKVKERELLEALAEHGELTPTTAALRTSLTVDEASKMLEELARKGHLQPRAEIGVMVYALGERDRHERPASISAPAESGSDGGPRRLGAPRQLEDPLSEREIEVLGLFASGRTNSEVARDLFVSVGTVKSHTGNIYRKLDSKNRVEALARARELGVIQ